MNIWTRTTAFHSFDRCLERIKARKSNYVQKVHIILQMTDKKGLIFHLSKSFFCNTPHLRAFVKDCLVKTTLYLTFHYYVCVRKNTKNDVWNIFRPYLWRKDKTILVCIKKGSYVFEFISSLISNAVGEMVSMIQQFFVMKSSKKERMIIHA